MTSSGLIIAMHRGSGAAAFRREVFTGFKQRLLSRTSPSFSATVRAFQQPPLSQHGSEPRV
jgi:hypothetical protein